MIAATTFHPTFGTTGEAQAAQDPTMLKKAKAKSASEQFEAMFLNSMFQQMFTGVEADGPFGGSNALKVWRSFLTDQYAKTFAKNGGLGIASHVYEQLLQHQGIKA
ncbi:MAG: rod-binding protein [Xanthobacteraceae bacterium]